ncbi:hypothetical protein FAY30_26615 (plasmid) [Bacillus sp. S3]|uniref:hypothetical protein n=1 Tax=Bacillus sp. S3 TaxID=486398 RepID=UPI00118A2A79|nr:hypothetical protein [Bacillus sp. S3]QCJ45514.1 hypothetical protein FAY30_26615 [Bacillus sp. S3]
MKKSYSSWNLLQSKLTGSTEPEGFFKGFFTNRKYITIQIPYFDYLRGKIFVNDLKDNFNEEVPYRFDLSVLIYLLYDDFLNQVKRGAKPQQISDYLKAGKQKYFQKRVEQKRIMKPLTKHVFEFETIEEEIDDNHDKENKTAYLELRMRESEVLRGEVLIHDLEPFLKGTEVTIEELIAIVYLDFIDNVKSEGNSLKVQKSILTHIKRF